jgi:O-antigen/teichoic acid export membrane protein
MLKRSITLLGARFGGVALAFLFNLLIARQLPEADYSLAIYFYATVVLASLIARNGNHVWIPRNMVRMAEPAEKIDVAVLGIAQAVFYGGIIGVATFFYFLAAKPDTATTSVMINVVTALAISGAIVGHTICETLASVFVGFKRPIIAGVASFVLPNLLLLSVAFLFPVRSFFDYSMLLFFSYGVVAVAVLAAGFIWTRPKFTLADPRVFSLAPIIEHFPVTSVVLVLYLNANLDIFVLGNLGSAEDMALFGFVFKIAASISMLSVTPRMISGPIFSERHHAGDISGIKQEFRRITLLMTFFAALAGAAILVIFPYLIDFVGKYGDHGGLLYVILLGSVVNVMFGPLLLVLNMTENNHSLWKYGTGFLLVKLALLIGAYEYLNLFWYATAGTLMVVVWNMLLFRLFVVRVRA